MARVVSYESKYCEMAAKHSYKAHLEIEHLMYTYMYAFCEFYTSIRDEYNRLDAGVTNIAYD